MRTCIITSLKDAITVDQHDDGIPCCRHHGEEKAYDAFSHDRISVIYGNSRRGVIGKGGDDHISLV